MTNVAQAYFLGRMLGPDRVLLEGEPELLVRERIAAGMQMAGIPEGVPASEGTAAMA